jgi:hypothetical protein
LSAHAMSGEEPLANEQVLRRRIETARTADI